MIFTFICNKRLRTAGIAGMTAAALVACGDDDDGAAPSPDAGTPSALADAGSSPLPGPDGGPGGDAAPDAPPSPASITPRSVLRVSNAINPYGLVYASDGYLYASGATIEGGDRKLAVWRFSNGALDATFGAGGVVTLALDGDESSWGMVEVAPGSFVVEATAGGRLHLVKLTKDGGGAFAFGTPVEVELGGWADPDPDWPGGSPPAYASWGIAVDRSVAASPKIVIFAHGAPAKVASGDTQRTDNDRWIARVLADTLAADPAFNGGKAFSTDVDGKGLSDGARRGIVLPDGSIVSAGYTNFGSGLGNHVVLIKLTPAGTPDATFGFGSTVAGQTKINPFLSTGGFAEAYGVAAQSTGRLVTTGYGTTNFDVPSESVDLVSLGVVPGKLDATFGKLGAFAWQSEPDESAGLGATPHADRGRDVAVLPDDRAVHFGAYDDFASIFVVSPAGARDGVVEYAFPAAFFRGVVSPDGKHIAATTQSITQTVDGGAVSQSLLVTLDVGP